MESCNSNIPKDLLCPISGEIMQDPVIALDGYTYERTNIKQWFSQGNTISYKTGEKIADTILPNRNLL